MTDIDRERERVITRGLKAKDILNNPAFEEAMEEVLADLFVRFQGTSAEQALEREKLWAVGRAVGAVRDRLTAFVDAARIEEQNKAQDAKR